MQALSYRRDFDAARSSESDARLVDLRLRFAKAIARPGTKALLISPDNSHDGWLSLPNAVASGRAYAVEVAEDVLAIDCDDSDRRHVVEPLATRCRNAGYRPVMLNSGQPGRIHLLTRVLDPVSREGMADFARQHRLDVRSCIRPPLSPHRLDLPLSFIAPTDPNDALIALEFGHRAHRLSRRMHRLLRNGDSEARYESRSEVVQAIATGAINACWSERRLYWALRDERNVAGVRVREIAERQGDTAAEQCVHRTWLKATRYALANPPVANRPQVLALIEALRDAANRLLGPGLAGGTDRAVLGAHADIAAMTGKFVYSASVREIAEYAGVSYPTVSRSNRRLCGAGWLSLVTSHRGTDAATWRLGAGQLRETLTLHTSGGVSEC